MAKRRTRRAHNSHHLAQWNRFNVPQLMVDSQTEGEINIFGPIVTEDTAEFWQWWFDTDYYTSDVDMQQILAESKAQHKKLIFNSPGGDVWGGSAIRSFIQTEMGKGFTFEAHVVGIAASAAAIIAVACPKVVMADMAQMMIHRAAVGYDAWGYGNEDDLQIAINDFESRKQSLREINKAQIQAFMDKSGKTREQVQELLRKETWFNAQSALDEGFANEIQSSGFEPAAIQSASLPEGFNLTPHGGAAHERPAYSFAAALGASAGDDGDGTGDDDDQGQQGQQQQQVRQDEPPAEPPPSNTQGVSSMYDAQVRTALGLPPGTELTIAHWAQAYGILYGQHQDIEKKLAKVEKKSVLARAKAAFDKHVSRGAITPFQSANTLSRIMDAADPEEQLEIQDEIFSGLPDGDNDGQTARKSKGTGKAADGLDDAPTGADETRQMAYEFKLAMDELVDAGMEIGTAQDTVMAKLGDAHFEAYNHFDFDNDKEDPPEVE